MAKAAYVAKLGININIWDPFFEDPQREEHTETRMEDKNDYIDMAYDCSISEM